MAAWAKMATVMFFKLANCIQYLVHFLIKWNYICYFFDYSVKLFLCSILFQNIADNSYKCKQENVKEKYENLWKYYFTMSIIIYYIINNIIIHELKEYC